MSTITRKELLAMGYTEIEASNRFNARRNEAYVTGGKCVTISNGGVIVEQKSRMGVKECDMRS